VAVSALLSARPAPPTVLVVDDEPSMHRMLDRLLAFYRFVPLQASDVEQATFVAARERVDAFVVDLTLQRGGSGLEMVGWLRRQQEYAQSPVFVLTSDLEIPDDQRMLIQQHQAHLFYKGQSLELLIDRLQRVLVEAS
jgi:DNA-binding response OmpR family regulator